MRGRAFVTSLYGTAETSVARGLGLKETMAATREVMDPKFSSPKARVSALGGSLLANVRA